jgi:hypothetical protein
MLARHPDFLGVGIQALYGPVVGRAERGRQPTLAAADMHGQAAANPGNLMDLLGGPVRCDRLA